jgi:hypothetical protein
MKIFEYLYYCIFCSITFARVKNEKINLYVTVFAYTLFLTVTTFFMLDIILVTGIARTFLKHVVKSLPFLVALVAVLTGLLFYPFIGKADKIEIICKYQKTREILLKSDTLLGCTLIIGSILSYFAALSITIKFHL